MNCHRHPQREAAARCPECARFFCRECVTEHEGKLVCASCLAKEAAADAGGRSAAVAAGARRLPWAASLQLAVAIFSLWWLAFLGARILLAIPSSVHEGNVVKEAISE